MSDQERGIIKIVKEKKAELITRGKQVCKGRLKEIANGNRKREI